MNNKSASECQSPSLGRDSTLEFRDDKRAASMYCPLVLGVSCLHRLRGYGRLRPLLLQGGTSHVASHVAYHLKMKIYAHHIAVCARCATPRSDFQQSLLAKITVAHDKQKENLCIWHTSSSFRV